MSGANPTGSYPGARAQAGALALGILEPEAATEEPIEVIEEEVVLEASEQEFEASDELEEDEVEGEAEVEPEQLHTVRADGEELQVTYDELLAGYSRETDYRRKTMSLADERRALESEFGEVRQERSQYSTLLTQLEQQIAAPLGQEPDWDNLFATNPTEATRIKYEWDKQVQALQAIQSEQHRISQEQAREAQNAQNALIQSEGEKLLGAMKWTPEQYREEMPKLASYGIGAGFTQQDLVGIVDHRQWVILDKARRWDEANKTAGSKIREVRSGPKAATPGQAIPAERKSRKKRQETLSGVKDAKSFASYWAATNP